jgi:hypothetical protein
MQSRSWHNGISTRVVPLGVADIVRTVADDRSRGVAPLSALVLDVSASAEGGGMEHEILST